MRNEEKGVGDKRSCVEVRRTVYNGASLSADFYFQEISGQEKNFTQTAPANFEFLINSIDPKIAKNDTTYRSAVSVEQRRPVTLRVLTTGDLCTSMQ
jgi:signal transduction protein with GAF and PtsI domain